LGGDVRVRTLLKVLLVLILWQTGILSSIFAVAGGLLIWLAAMLQPTVMIGVL
jgi:hypothetical protein